MSLTSLLQTGPPDVAVEIEADHVAAARLVWRGGEATIAAHTLERVAPGVIVPALATLNIVDLPAAGQAIGRALASLGARTRRVALVIPDTVAKVSLVRFENVPPSAQDLLELVRWQIKKTTPFPVEEAMVSFTPGARHDDGQEFVVAAARKDIIEQYEQACALAGVHAGLIDLSTFSVVNGLLASKAPPARDWLLVHVTPTYTSLTVVRDNHVIFFRNRADDSEGTLADIVHQTAMYYEDRLKGAGFTRVLLAGAADVRGGATALRQTIEERLSLHVETVDPRGSAALVDRITASPELLDTLAPLVGILLRERRAA